MSGRLADARATLARARDGNPYSEEYLLLELDGLAAEGRYADAIARLDAEAWRHPKSGELTARSATWRLAAGRLSSAARPPG